MRYDLALHTGQWLADAITLTYPKGIKDVLNTNKKNIGKFARQLFKVDYGTVDINALKNFKIEAFTVANIGIYELEEKLKALAVDVLKNKKGSVEDFKKLSKDLILQYVPMENVPPSGYLETNYNTAVKSCYNAAKWQRLQDPSVKALYPYYQFKTRKDSRVRDEHSRLDDKVYSADDPAWSVIVPPLDWNCRCYFIQLTRSESGDKTIEPISSEADVKNIIDEAGIGKDFRRNPGETASIWGKWIKSKLKEMDTKAIYNDMLEYVKANKPEGDAPMLEVTKLEKVNESLGKFERKPQADYDTDKILISADEKSRQVVAKILKQPNEVWGKTTVKDGKSISTVNYIKNSGKGSVIASVVNGELVEVKILNSFKELDKYRKGTLMKMNN